MLFAEGTSKQYGDVAALAPLSLRVGSGEKVAIVGPSGSGKTTLLHLLSNVIQPTNGRVYADDRPLDRLSGRKLARVVGVMHQQFDLVPHLAVVHNVLAGRLGEWGLLKSIVSLVAPREVDRARAALGRVGIPEKLHERTSRLSGGEQQRVALARLLLQDPAIIIADEPVSSVDPARAEDVIRLLAGIAEERRKTLIVSLHSVALALAHFDRVIGLREGRLAFDLPVSQVTVEQLASLYALEGSGEAQPRGPLASPAP